MLLQIDTAALSDSTLARLGRLGIIDVQESGISWSAVFTIAFCTTILLIAARRRLAAWIPKPRPAQLAIALLALLLATGITFAALTDGYNIFESIIDGFNDLMEQG